MKKSFKTLALALAITLAGIGMAQATQYTVKTQLVCLHDAANQAFADMQYPDAAIPKEGCNRLPFPIVVKIKRIVAGPIKDFEGDYMYLVFIGNDTYTLAFPGINSDMPMLREAQ